jgi:hypothetical protein
LLDAVEGADRDAIVSGLEKVQASLPAVVKRY